MQSSEEVMIGRYQLRCNALNWALLPWQQGAMYTASCEWEQLMQATWKYKHKFWVLHTRLVDLYGKIPVALREVYMSREDS